MSSKPGRKVWSLSTRLFAWYSAATAVISGLTIVSVYFAMAVRLDQETDNWMREGVKYLDKELTAGSSEPNEWMTSVVQVADASGRVVFESAQLLRQFPVSVFRGEGLSGVDQAGMDGRVYRLLNIRHDGRRYLLAQDRSYERELMATFRRNGAIAVIPSFAVTLIVGYCLAQWGLGPVKRIIAAARAVSPITLNGRVPVEGQPSDLRELAETLNSVLDKLEDAFRRLDAFSADVAHELRTPVQNLRGSIEVALSQERRAEDYRQTLLTSLNEADRLGRLVDRLLLLARSEDPRHEVRLEPTEVTVELEDIREFFAPMATESGISVIVTSDVRDAFPLDRSLFQRGISNLVANALAHTGHGATIELKAHADEKQLAVAVADTGTGIDQKELPYLFDRFYRSASVRNKGRGVGLGLAIVKRVAELHGGKVAIESTPGIGTTVELIFPR